MCGLSKDESVPELEFNEAVVFLDFFVCGLRLPLVRFVKDVLETFGV
jgi:hypothetical protein